MIPTSHSPSTNFPPELEPFAERLYDVLLWHEIEDPRDVNGSTAPQERSKHSSSVATKEENMVLIRKTLQQVYDLGKSDEAADEYIRTVE